jgi:hypothetical protein
MSGATISPWTVVVTAPSGQELARANLRPGVPLTIGRAPESSIMLGLMTVSRHHGRIELVNGLPRYFPEPGALATLLDGDPVEGATPLGERTLLEIGGYRFTLQRQRAAMAAAPARPASGEVPAPDGGSTLLDRHIQGVKLHRTEAQKEAESRSAQWERGWQELVAQARQIQARYGRHPRMLEFTISKDEREVVIKLKEDSRRGYAYFCLSRAHPEGKYPDMQAVWLREVGRGDDSFSDPVRGLEELVSRIAPRLA